jgi:hypothetical protein
MKRSRSSSSSVSSSTSNFTRVSPSSKYAQLERPHLNTSSMRCLLPPHKSLNFPSYADYETHYTQQHSNRCSSCNHNFPTSYFLNLHIAENHDPIVSARRERGEKTFACFVEGCEKVCSGWTKRRSHLVDKHGFPRNYDFLVVNSGVDGKRSMLRPGVDTQGHRASSRERRESDGTDTMEGTQSTPATSASPPPIVATAKAHEATPAAIMSAEPVKDTSANSIAWRGKKRSGSTTVGAPLMPAKTDLEDIIKSMSALNMVPRSVAQKKGQSGK